MGGDVTGRGFVTSGGGAVTQPRKHGCGHGGGAELAQGTVCWWEGLDRNKRGELRGVGESGGAQWGVGRGEGQFCVVMTTSCAIRTHSVTITTTTQGSCRVSAKQPL